MDARDQLRDKLNQQGRQAEQDRRWSRLFTRLLLIWASVFITGYLMLPDDAAIGALVAIFAAGLGVATTLAIALARKP